VGPRASLGFVATRKILIPTGVEPRLPYSCILTKHGENVSLGVYAKL